MDTTTVKLVTIVCEAVLRERLIAELGRLGVKGFTLSEVTGEGSRHLRSSEVPGDNIKLETIVGPKHCDQLLTILAGEYFPNYAMIAYVSDVQVIRGEKYGD